jgi:hypothetical protein
MHPLVMFLLALFLIVQGLEFLGITFNGSRVVKGLLLTLAGIVLAWFSL